MTVQNIQNGRTADNAKRHKYSILRCPIYNKHLPRLIGLISEPPNIVTEPANHSGTPWTENTTYTYCLFAPGILSSDKL